MRSKIWREDRGTQMADDDSLLKKSRFILDEIEEQLKVILSKKREEIERELEEKIQKERDLARKKIDEIEQEMAAEKEALVSYREILSEFKADNVGIKEQIKRHLDKAAEIQVEIESKASMALEELKKVHDLSRRLETLNQEAVQRMETHRSDLEKKYGVGDGILDRDRKEAAVSQIENEMERLGKIKELLLTSRDPGALSEAKLPPKGQKAETEIHSDAKDKVRLTDKRRREEVSIRYGSRNRKSESDSLVSTLQEELDKYRKYEELSSDIEISYYENQDKITLDGEYIIAAVSKNLEEARDLYNDLYQTQSPQTQFSIQQDIKKYQESIRHLLLNIVRMTESKTCNLPQYTTDILNGDTVKAFLERLSLEDWNNQEEFTSFYNLFHDTKEEFYKRITPPSHYLESIMQELRLMGEI
jgi:hypothetical protein